MLKTLKAPVSIEAMSPDELRAYALDKLIRVGTARRGAFVAQLESGMRQRGLDMRSYLIPIGIVNRAPDDLTANEIAHLCRFLTLVVPESRPAVVSALALLD